jgi:hypothetical protein
MSVANFVPEITAAKVEEAYLKEGVVIATLTPSYDGEAKSGNAVNIVNAELPTVEDYAAAGRRFTPEELASTTVKILIDQEKSVAQRIDNIDKRQAAGPLDPFTNGQGKALAKDAERHVIATLLAEGTAVNITGATPITVTDGTKAKAAVRKVMLALDDAEVPADGRFLVINSAFKDLLVDELSDASKSGSTDALRKGEIGTLYGFTILHSTDVAEKVKPVAIGYHEAAAAYVGQVDESRAVPAQDGHADILSTVLVYGTKVTRPRGVATFVSGGVAAA